MAGASAAGLWRRMAGALLANCMLIVGAWQCRDRHALSHRLCQSKRLSGGMTGNYTAIIIGVDCVMGSGFSGATAAGQWRGIRLDLAWMEC
jgi:hypothetical protein